MRIEERLAGGIFGLLVGDALGVPYEFHRPDELPARDQIEMDPPPGFHRAHRSAPPHAWSDDGAQALCLLESLLECGRLDPANLADSLLLWKRKGLWAVDGVVYDCGSTTARALARIAAGVPALEAGPAGEGDNGNGALMRVLPLALWHQGCDADLARDARLQSRVTHGHLRSQVCCALYCLWARRILQNAADPWAEALQSLRTLLKDDRAALDELDLRIRPEDPPDEPGGGYVVDCLRSARWAFNQGSFPEVVRAAISLGRDTDTTACVAGGLAGVRDGLGAILAPWLEALRGREMVEPLVSRLCDRWPHA